MKLELIIGQADPIDCLNDLEKIGCKFTEISREIDMEVANSFVKVDVSDTEDFLNKIKESFANPSFNTPDPLISIHDSDENELWSQ